MKLRHFWTYLHLYDRLTVGYLGLTLILIAFSAEALPIRARLVVAHIAAGIFIAGLIYWVHLRAETHRDYIPPRWLRFLRDWHPLFWFSFLLFGEFTYLVKSVSPFWIERYLIGFDLWLFGRPPYLLIQQYLPWWVIEVMAFAYWSYYPLILGVAGRYYFFRSENKKSRLSFVDFMNRLSLAFYICYLLFIIIPARSPRHALNLNEQLNLVGGPFYHMIAAMQDYVSVVGAAFPSSHVAIAWVALITLYGEHRRGFWRLVPLVVALTFSIFVLQYHYVLDAIAGVMLALGFEFFWQRFYSRPPIFSVTNLQSIRPQAATDTLT
ncbi:MAG: hypothetical protein ALAOOOJD_02574 [bacterium]|nr:hypothetical protein [bacterium]